MELSQRTQANYAEPSVFWACWPCWPAGWLALLLTKTGDVETNPGPTTLNKQVWICDICHKQIHVRKQISKGATVLNTGCTSDVQVSAKHNTQIPGLPSTQRIQTHTPHKHNSTPPLPTLVQVPYPLPTYTTHTTATKTQTHVQHSPCPYRIGEAQTQFYHPLTPLSTSNITQTHRPSSKREINVIILQVNINGPRNKLEALKLLIHDTHADITTIQETKLTPKAKMPKMHNFTAVRTDR